MEEGHPPPSSASTAAVGLKENVKRKSGSDADAAAAAAADDPKPTAWGDGLRMVDNDPPWGRPVRQVEEPLPAAWRDGFRVIDNDATWGRPVQEVEEPSPAARRSGWQVIDDDASWGHERRQGDYAGKGFSPRKQRQGTSSRVGKPQDISLRTKHSRDGTQDISPPRTSRRPGHDLEDSEDKMMTLASQDTSLVVTDAKPVSRDKEVAYLDFVFGSRSEREGKAWHCVCKATNAPRRKLVFSLPKFHCGCQREFLQKNDLDFCLADIRVNFELVVSRIFDQKGPHCIAHALCQAMLIMHKMDCITNSREVEEAMMHIDPMQLVYEYGIEYPLMDEGPQSKVRSSSVHKFIKMALMLKNRGFKLQDGTFFRIGDISFIAKGDYEAICEELSNGVPLLAVIIPGVNFEYLKYCEVYRPPLLQHFHDCNDYHKLQKHNLVHEAHMVVLIGPAFKANGQNRGRAYYFANSHPGWCERKVNDDYNESEPGIEKPVTYGIGKIEEEGLVYSVIKLWKFGETAGPGSITLEDEDEDVNKISNRPKFTGEYMARPSL